MGRMEGQGEIVVCPQLLTVGQLVLVREHVGPLVLAAVKMLLLILVAVVAQVYLRAIVVLAAAVVSVLSSQ
jgi:hypothetical protein